MGNVLFVREKKKGYQKYTTLVAMENDQATMTLSL